LLFGKIKTTAVIHEYALRTGTKVLQSLNGKVKWPRSREMRNQIWWMFQARHNEYYPTIYNYHCWFRIMFYL